MVGLGKEAAQNIVGTTPMTPHATRSFTTPGTASSDPDMLACSTMDLPSIPVGPARVSPGTRVDNVAVPCSHVRMGTTTASVVPGSTNGGPAENPFGDVQIGVVWITIRYQPEEKPPMSANILRPPS